MKRRPSAVNALFAVDKPCGMTSHDVVGVARRALSERAVGHAGTLDPDASGVLVLGVGQATKLLGLLTLETKAYEASIRFGCRTTTDDAEGAPVAIAPVPSALADHEAASTLVGSLPGDVDQVPPAYSAISVAGKRAYDLARQGEEVMLAPRKVSILRAELLSVASYDAIVTWRVFLEVSKGCYIRSIARDLGEDIGCHAHICGLRRVASGSINQDLCLSLEELQAGGVQAVRDAMIDPVAALGLPVRELSAQEQIAAAQGKHLARGPEPLGQGDHVCLVRQGQLYGVWEARGRHLVCATNLVRGVEGVRNGGARKS